MADDNSLFSERFLISSVSLHEIEHIKTNNNKTDDVKYNARKISRLLDKNYTLYDVVVYSNDIAKYITYDLGLDATIPDNQIVGIASYIQKINGKDVIFVTNDICLKNIARSLGLVVESVKKNKIDEYKGFVEKSLSEEEMAYFYEHLNENVYDLLVNEYLILKNDKDEAVDTLKWNGESYEPIKCKSFKSNIFGI